MSRSAATTSLLTKPGTTVAPALHQPAIARLRHILGGLGEDAGRQEPPLMPARVGEFGRHRAGHSTVTRTPRRLSSLCSASLNEST